MMRVPRRIGRPPIDVDDDSVPVHLKMPGRAYDVLWRRAQRERCSVPELIRRELAVAATRRDDEQD
jgi:hypothetical protein